MSDLTEPIVPLRRWPSGTTAEAKFARHSCSGTRERIAFDRGEFNAILGLSGSKGANGEWRDYAIDFSVDKA